MKYFIPAWYDDQRWWQDTTVPYYQLQNKTEFDDMISLMGMHLENDLDYQLIVLNHAPNLRTFLHRYDLYETKYSSVFDEIQGFSHHAPQAINYHHLKWPDDVEFVYTPYLLKCVTSEQTYTNIYFSQEGYSIWFEEFERDQLQRRYIFDDRGYLSAIRYFDDQGEASYQEYLTINGDCVLHEDLKNGRVTVSKRYQHHYQQTEYNNMAQLIEEKFQAMIAQQIHEDDDLKEWLKEHVPGNHELKDTNVEVYFKEEQDNHLNYMSRLMNPVRFLDYLDVSKLNGGEVNET